jgi:hypothetical protein
MIICINKAMDNRLFIIWIQLLMIIAAPIIQIILSVYKLRNKIAWHLSVITFVSFLLGIILPIAATVLSISSLPKGIRCVTGFIGIAAIGFMITAITVPIIWATFRLMQHYKLKNKALTL